MTAPRSHPSDIGGAGGFASSVSWEPPQERKQVAPSAPGGGGPGGFAYTISSPVEAPSPHGEGTVQRSCAAVPSLPRRTWKWCHDIPAPSAEAVIGSSD